MSIIGRALSKTTMSESKAPTSKSGYEFPSKSVPPESEYPNVRILGKDSEALIIYENKK